MSGRPTQDLERAHAVDDAGSPGQGHDQPSHLPVSARRVTPRDAHLFDQPPQEDLALCHLVERHPFVGLVGLRDVAGAAQDGGNAGVVEQRSLGAEGHLVEDRAVVAATAELGDLAVGARVEAGQGGQLFERDAGVGGDGVHFGKEARGVGLDLAKEHVGIVERQMAELEPELAIPRHDVERRSALDRADVNRS